MVAENPERLCAPALQLLEEVEVRCHAKAYPGARGALHRLEHVLDEYLEAQHDGPVWTEFLRLKSAVDSSGLDEVRVAAADLRGSLAAKLHPH